MRDEAKIAGGVGSSILGGGGIEVGDGITGEETLIGPGASHPMGDSGSTI